MIKFLRKKIKLSIPKDIEFVKKKILIFIGIAWLLQIVQVILNTSQTRISISESCYKLNKNWIIISLLRSIDLPNL